MGSETNTTWGFAKTLHEALAHAGYRVHTTSMNRLARSYGRAQRMFILAATYGDGGPRTSGTHFLSRLKKFSGKPNFRFAVLGFGDRQFPKFCQFAVDVDTALHAKGWARLCPLDLIDRQSSQEFARWDLNIGEVMEASLSLNYQPERPRTLRLRLAERLAYGTRSAAGTYLGDSPPRWRCRAQRALAGQITNSFTAIEQCDTLISIELNHVKLESSYVCPD